MPNPDLYKSFEDKTKEYYKIKAVKSYGQYTYYVECDNKFKEKGRSLTTILKNILHQLIKEKYDVD